MSGSTVGAFAGAAIGFMWGGPAGARWGYLAGSIIGGIVDPDTYQGPRLTDAQTQTSNEGVPRPIIYGTACVAGNIIQSGPLVEHKKTQRAGKGGPEQTTYTYTRDVAIRICEAAPLGGTMVLRRVWKNDKLVYDASSDSVLEADSQAFASILTFYSGAEDQLPDPTLEALPTENGGGVGNVPAYRGTCYAVLTGLDVTETGGTVPQFRWEVCSDATEAPVDTGGVDAGELGGFINSHDPREDAESAYTYSGFWTDGLGGGVQSPTYNTIDEVLDYMEAYLVGFGITGIRPEHFIGYKASTSNGIGTYIDDVSDFDVTTDQPDASELKTVLMLYQWFLPDDGQFTSTRFQNANPSGTTKHGSCGGYVYTRESRSTVPGGIRVWTGVMFASGDGSSVVPVAIKVNRKRVAPPNVPAGSVAIPDKPGWYIDTSGNLIEEKVYTETTGVYKALSIGSGVTGVDPSVMVKAFPQGPVLASTDPNYSVQAYWDAAYAAAVAAGTMPAGMTYNAAGTGSANSTYPIFTTTVYTQEPSQGVIVTPGTVPLSSIVADICDRDGVGADQVDVTALAGIEVRGFAIARQTSAAEAIRALQQVYFFDFPEWGNSGELGTKLRAVLRGGAVAVTITDDDLVDNDDDEDTRAQQVEFPRKVNLTASDPDSNYEPITQPAERSTENVKAVGEASFSTNVVMTRDECAVVADKLLKMLWEQANGRTEVELPEEFTIYTSSDRASYKGKEWLIERTDTLDGSVRWKLTRDRASAYGSTATGSTALTPTPPVSSIRGPTMFAGMNLPRLRSQDTTPGMYVAVSGILSGWAGCDLYLSVDGGVSEQKVATILEPATMGVLTADLAAAGTPLSVRLYDGELDSVTVDQLLARLNAAAVTTDEVSEILQFQTATETAADEYDLTDLTRGELYTAADDHVTGDSFVLLDAAVVFVPLDIGLAGKVLIFRPVSIGTAPANNTTYEVTFRPQFTGPQVVEAYTDDAGNVYTDDAGNTYYYEVPPT